MTWKRKNAPSAMEFFLKQRTGQKIYNEKIDVVG